MAGITTIEHGPHGHLHSAPTGEIPDLLGPDLNLAADLSDQLARLDDALGAPRAYAAAWLAIHAEITGHVGSLVWRDGQASDHMAAGCIVYDEQEPERRRRIAALLDHLPTLPAYRAAIRDLLLTIAPPVKVEHRDAA